MDVSALIPIPIQIVIDDVGWWSGKDGSAYQQPYRTGIDRNHTVADYRAIVKLGKELGMRPQAAMILCEWDKNNILKNVPHSTWMGKKWDNSKWVGPWLEEAADVINNNKKHFEITMHGLGHEWWTNGIFTRAEWADDDGIMRPKHDIERHIQAFAEILQQNNLGELPKSFVPTNFSHSFGVTKGNDVSMAEILREHGFSYINTPYNYNFHNIDRVQYGVFGVDSGVLTVDRGSDLLDWNVIGVIPEGKINGVTCGMHWANLLHEDPERNSEIVDGWVKVLAPYKNKPETMLAENSLVYQKQLVHSKLTKTTRKENKIEFDFSATDNAGTIISNDEFTIKIKSQKELSFSSGDIQINSVSSNKESDSVLYSLNLKRKGKGNASITYKSA